MILLVFMLLLAVPVAACLLLVRAVRAVATRRLTHREGAAAWAEAAGWLLCCAVLAYGVGVGFMFLTPWPDWCPVVKFSDAPDPSAAPPHPRVENGWFPLKARCVSDVHTPVDFIPAAVNPVLLGSLAGAAGCASMSVWRRRRPAT
ncbi:hypothetical protein [Streptomyces roseoverticillatus]|uniref:hypothetical protein n=1 Tax=Streptomyces roseoverticillatus TaxID=66429 RepID=UPI0004C299B3|nr:hypothetical protein [Streptomyces roseoverticillatus]